MKRTLRKHLITAAAALLFAAANIVALGLEDRIINGDHAHARLQTPSTNTLAANH